jgi:hypothetical protein
MITTPNTLPAQVQQTMDDVLLSVRTPNLIMKLGALSKRLPAKGGRTLRMSRYDRLPTAPVPLGPSGATLPATPLSRVDKNYVHIKSSLIDLEAYGKNYGDRAQAYAAA